jgi:hypothetical protein
VRANLSRLSPIREKKMELGGYGTVAYKGEIFSQISGSGVENGIKSVKVALGHTGQHRNQGGVGGGANTHRTLDARE